MGMSTKAQLFYGYHLRDADEKWLVREVYGEDEDGYGLKLDWLDPDDSDIQGAAMQRLLDAVGYTEDPGADRAAWRQRLEEAYARIGVEFEHSGYEYGELFLVAKEFFVELGDVKVIDPAELIAVASEAADEHLRKALEVLGLTPLQEKPAWLLSAERG